MSQPTRAAWIEIHQPYFQAALGELSRSPLGLRGLKFEIIEAMQKISKSQPTRAAWIEIRFTSILRSFSLSQPTRAAWIEILNKFLNM